MNRKVILIAIGLTLVHLVFGGLCAQGALDPSAPASPVKLIFIHHSCGENWLADWDGGLGIALRDNNYFVSDTNYGWGPDGIGDNTDIGHWWDWFRGSTSSTYLQALYTESEQFGDYYSRLGTGPGGENEIIMFKSCFPNSYLGGSPGDPPASATNPLRGQDSGSEYMTVANAKGIYNDILTYFASRQDKLFVAITAPPQVTNETDSEHAANARAFNNWLVNDWLDGYAYDNVAVFDFYNVLTSNGGDNDTNDAGQETGNHHRWWNGAIQHIQTVDNNVASYASWEDDSHPTAAGNQKATEEFLDLLNIYYHLWQGTGVSAPTVITGLATSVTSDSATLNGTVNPNGLETSCYFEYGPTISYGSTTATQMLGSGTGNISEIRHITGLDADTTYHFRLVATNSAGTTYGSDESFQTSAAQPPAHVLYFPHVDTTSPWGTEIALINTSSTQILTGTLRAYGNNGQAIDTMAITLAPHARRQITISQEFTDHTSIGYLTFEGSADTACGYTKFFQQGTFRVAVPAVDELNTSDIYISHIDSSDQWWTGISLLNTTTSEKTLTLRFDTGQSTTLTLAAKEHQAFTIKGLFNEQSQPDIGSAVITNASGIVGLELFGSGNQLSGILLKDATASTIYYPHIASDATWWTGIVAYNPASSSATLTITPFTEAGTPLPTQTVEIGPNEKYVGTAAMLALPSETAWIKIGSTEPITGFELFGTHNGNQLAGYTGVGISSKAGVFAKLEKDGWTGIAFVNIEDSPAQVTLTAYDNYGNAVATQTLSLGSYAKEVGLAQDFFTQDISAATYIGYSSDREIVGFQLNGSSDDMMLDGLPAGAGGVTNMTLANVEYWSYNIQDVDTQRQREELVGTHFDMYVLEPVITEKDKENFDMASLIQDIRDHNIQTRNVNPLIIAYVDVGQAESWRWYYDDSWEIGNPEWLVGEDPDLWEGCYPVAYWHQDWEDIVIYGHEGRSMVEETLKAGFDGIYMDWVEAFSDENVMEKAAADGVDPVAAMFDFIEKIRHYARNQSPHANAGYLVIAQNASDLYQEDPARYRRVIDAIALEAIWYDGTGGFDDWDDSTGYNVLTNEIYPGYTEEVLAWLEPMKAHMPIFCVEYAQDVNGQECASEVYHTLAPAHGFIPYCTRRSLARLSTTPYPFGYEPIDY